MQRLITAGVVALALGLFTLPGRAAGTVTSPTEASFDTALNGGGTVTIACDGTIPITHPKTIAANTTIDATGHRITLDGQNRVYIFAVNPHLNFTLRNLTIANGYYSSVADGAGSIAVGGGAIYAADSNVTITNCTLVHNVTVAAAGADYYGAGQNGGDALGGAVYVANGNLSVNGSTFSANEVRGGNGGAGYGDDVYDQDGYGGDGGYAFGGAVYVEGFGTTTLTNCTLSGNLAAGGQGGAGYSAYDSRNGTALYGYGGYGGRAFGGGLSTGDSNYSTNAVTVTNCTFGGNDAAGGAAGPGDTAPGVAGAAYGNQLASLAANYPATLRNSIFAYGHHAAQEVYGYIRDGGYNLTDDGSLSATTDIHADPHLAALANNGGPTPTMAIPATSAAVNHGNDAVAPPTDQRGVARSGISDIGAYEFAGLFSIQGRVTNSSGVGLANVKITRSGSTGYVLTDSNANYTLTGLPNGTYTVTPSLAGYSFTPAYRTVTVSGANITGQNFTATPSATACYIAGRITNSSGVGLAGAAVTRTGSSAVYYTNSTGYYAIGNVPNGTYTITPSLSGYAFNPAYRVVTVNGANVSGQNFIGSVAHTITGRIATGNGVAVLNVKVVRSGSTAAFYTNSAGYYTITGVPDGTYTVTPSLAGYSFIPAYRSVMVNGANVTGQNFTAVSGYSVSGRIANSSGVALPGVAVYRTGSATPIYTNSAGYFTFTGVPNGTYTITPSWSGHSFTPASRSVTVYNANVVGVNFIGY